MGGGYSWDRGCVVQMGARRARHFEPTVTVAIGPGPIPIYTIFQSNSNAFSRSKNIQTLHEAWFEHDEQLSPLVQVQISTGFLDINFGTNSNLNLPLILKGFKPCAKILINSLKFYLDLIFTNVNLVGLTSMQANEVPTHVKMAWFGNKEKSLNLKFKPN
jgi:hypothetical protein